MIDNINVVFPDGSHTPPLPKIYYNDLFYFDLQEMKKICQMGIDEFNTLPNVQRLETPDGTFLFIPSPGAKVLAVAHRDFVAKSNHFGYLNLGEDLVYSPSLDDRMGCYILLHVLPQLGINADILLTEGEEAGKSTAKHFKIKKKYNWMFEFDRKREDVVLYQYEMESWEKALKAVDFKIGQGFKSDIWYLNHLGCCGVNIGCGYEDYHSERSHAFLNETARQILRFKDFYDDYQNKFFEFDEKKIEKRHTPQHFQQWNNDLGTHFLPEKRKVSKRKIFEVLMTDDMVASEIITINNVDYKLTLDFELIKNPPKEDLVLIRDSYRWDKEKLSLVRQPISKKKSLVLEMCAKCLDLVPRSELDNLGCLEHAICKDCVKKLTIV